MKANIVYDTNYTHLVNDGGYPVFDFPEKRNQTNQNTTNSNIITANPPQSPFVKGEAQEGESPLIKGEVKEGFEENKNTQTEKKVNFFDKFMGKLFPSLAPHPKKDAE